jgi:hypothetical protein
VAIAPSNAVSAADDEDIFVSSKSRLLSSPSLSRSTRRLPEVLP